MTLTIKKALELLSAIKSIFEGEIIFELADPLIDLQADIDKKTADAIKKLVASDAEKKPIIEKYKIDQSFDPAIVDDQRLKEIVAYQNDILSKEIVVIDVKIKKEHFPKRTIGKNYMILRELCG